MILETEQELLNKVANNEESVMENCWGQVQSKLWLEKIKQPCNTDIHQDESSSK